MSLISPAMGPERVLPSSEDDLGEDQRPPVEGAAVWATEEAGEEEEEEGDGGENNGGYYYQPLNQDPDGQDEEGGADASHTEQVQQVQQRIEVMGLHLPEAPPPDSDEEEDPEGAAAQRSRASIPMDADHVELVKRTMAGVALPSLGVPSWAQEISDEQWKDMVELTLQSRQNAAAMRLPRRGNLNAP